MEKKPTDDMMQEIKGTNSIDKYFKDNNKYMLDRRACDCLDKLIEEKNAKKHELFEKACIADSYGYQILSGKRTVSKDIVLKLLISLGLTVDEIQLALKNSGCAQLYPKSKRDAIIIFGISKGKSIVKINIDLEEANQELL